MRESRRVVVTGLGMASAIGLDEETVWGNLVAGRGGIDHLRGLDVTNYRVKIGAEVDSEGVKERLRSIKLRPVDRTLDLALVAGSNALEQAGLITGGPPYLQQDVAVVFGTGVGSAQSHYNSFEAFFAKGVKGLRPTTVPKCMYNAISSGLSIHFGLSGANYVIVSACTSSTNAIGSAFRSVRDGYAETVLCGGAEGFFDPFFFGVWENLGVLSANPEPGAACRPFAIDRDGCVLGEGAGALVIETLERARARGARIRGEIVGYGESSDALHRTRPSQEGQVMAMRRALEDARVAPGDLGLISAHGTATESNDSCESASIRAVLGEAVDSVPVVANKSYFGHTLGASGALEMIVALLALERGLAPPNLNLDRPDPECRIHLVGDHPTPLDKPFAMKNSFGFGGGNGVVVVRRFD